MHGVGTIAPMSSRRKLVALPETRTSTTHTHTHTPPTEGRRLSFGTRSEWCALTRVVMSPHTVVVRVFRALLWRPSHRMGLASDCTEHAAAYAGRPKRMKYVPTLHGRRRRPANPTPGGQHACRAPHQTDRRFPPRACVWWTACATPHHALCLIAVRRPLPFHAGHKFLWRATCRMYCSHCSEATCSLSSGSVVVCIHLNGARAPCATVGVNFPPRPSPRALAATLRSISCGAAMWPLVRVEHQRVHTCASHCNVLRHRCSRTNNHVSRFLTEGRKSKNVSAMEHRTCISTPQQSNPDYRPHDHPATATSMRCRNSVEPC